jgi:hypothetical protein
MSRIEIFIYWVVGSVLVGYFKDIPAVWTFVFISAGVAPLFLHWIINFAIVAYKAANDEEGA